MRAVLRSGFSQVAARRFRAYASAALLLGLAGFFLRHLATFHPLSQWLALRYAAHALAGLLWVATATIAGHAALLTLVGRTGRAREHFALSVALGAGVAFVVTFGLGLLGLLGTPVFFVLPVLLLALSAPVLRRTLPRYARAWKRFRPRRQVSPLEFVALGLGVLGLFYLYLPVLNPGNLAYDSRWYHQSIAEQYAVTGRVFAFKEGWFLGAYPHLASMVFTWAHSCPFGTTFDRVMIAAHQEVWLFVATLIGIPALVRRLTGRESPVAWVFVFLFPKIWLYDSNLNGSADHIAAIFAVPLLLAAFEAARFNVRWGAVFGLVAGLAAATKYSAVNLVVGPALLLTIAAVVAVLRRKSTLAKVGSVLATCGIAGTLVTAPHWVKNWVFYGNPVYPLALDRFPGSLITPETKSRFVHFTPPEWFGSASPSGLFEALKQSVLFSFQPHDWPYYHGPIPLFGSLFTLGLLVLPLLPAARRIWALYFCAQLGIVFWFVGLHQDRYLQTMLPWMAAAVAAVGVRCSQLGWAPRVGFGALVVVQLSWGLDVPFIPTHVMLGKDSGVRHTAAFLARPFVPHPMTVTKRFDLPFEIHGTLEAIGRELPKGATVLLHEEHASLGLRARVVSDWVGWQGGLSYVRLAEPGMLRQKLEHELHVTHVLSVPNRARGYDTLGGDLLYFRYVRLHGTELKSIGGMHLMTLKHDTAEPRFRGFAAVSTCSEYVSGLYRLGALTVPNIGRAQPRSAFPRPSPPLPAPRWDATVLAGVDAVAFESPCGAPPGMPPSFARVATRGNVELWVRTRD